MRNKFPEPILKMVEDYLIRYGYTCVHIQEITSGCQSRVFAFDTVDALKKGKKLILKIFTNDYQHNSENAMRAEFDALNKFRSALEATGQVAEITCPSPIRLFESHRAYLMSSINGESLNQFLNKSALSNDEIATKITVGLQIYYQELKSIYGDFHPGNILIGPGCKVGFIDPTLPTPFFYSFVDLSFQPVSIDLGYWLFTIASTSAKQLVLNPRLCIRRWNFTKRLLHSAIFSFAPDAEEAFVQEITNVSLSFLNQLRKQSAIKGSLLYIVGNRVINYLSHALYLNLHTNDSFQKKPLPLVVIP